MFPLDLNFAALSLGAACDAWAAYMQVVVQQVFSVFGLEAPFQFQTFCNLIDVGDLSGILNFLPF